MGFERLHRASSLPRGGAVVEPSSSTLVVVLRVAEQEVFGDLEAVVARIADTARRAGEARLTR
jgi:hypothetical protein